MIIKPFITLQTHYCSGNQSHQYLMSALSLLAEGFNEFFHAKIAKIMDRLKLIQKTQNPNKFIEDVYQTELRIGTLTLVSYIDVINIVKSIPPKSCDLDSIPTKILKIHIDALAHGVM